MFKIRHGNSLYFLNTTPIYPRCETYCTDFVSMMLLQFSFTFVNYLEYLDLLPLFKFRFFLVFMETQ